MQGMSARVRILLLEDSSEDAELIEHQLRESDIPFALQLASGESDFLKALAEFRPDLILADYKLPAFSGLAALELARWHSPETPFIFVSGALGEEVAVEALQRGAADYVLKDRLERLVTAVRRALQVRQADQAAEESEQKFQALTELLPAIVFVHQDGKFRYLNPAAERILGYPMEKLLTMDFWEVVHPDSRELVRTRGIGRQQGEAIPNRYPFQIVRPDGGTRWLDCSAVRIEFEGHPAVLGSALDITENKQAEVRRAAFSTLAHKLSSLSTPREAARLIVQIAADLLGWDACYLHLLSEGGEIVPVLTMDLLNGQATDVQPATFTLQPSPMMRRVIEEGAQLINRESAAAREDLIPFGDKSRRSASLLYVPIRNGARVIGVLSIQSYTPHAYNAEALNTLQALADYCSEALGRIDAAETLRQSESRNRALLDALPDFIFRIRNDGTILDFRAPRDAASGGDTSCAPRKNSKDRFWKTLAQETVCALRQSGQFGASRSFEFRCSLSGENRDFEVRVGVSGPDELLLVVRDVTERRRLEREVLEISGQERQRLGHDLHDGLGQYLAGVAVRARMLADDLARDCSTRLADARQLVQLINHSISQARDVARGLDPIEVEARGLLPALQKLALDSANHFGLECQFQCAQTDPVVSKFASLQLYRIAQEAITNAARHGHARHITIDLDVPLSGLRLSVRDDGAGFDTNSEPLGMGLRIMRYRAHAIGGVLNVRSRSNHGVQIECVVPARRPRGSECASPRLRNELHELQRL
jgi:PAS domain S-box-containing protein